MFRCIKDLLLDVYDDGFVIEEQYMKVAKDSEWVIPEQDSYRFIGGEIRLENDDAEWIEICKDTLKEYFIEVM